ncbi:MAG: hypothetical protein JWO94_1616 [Verrucomicrobiaceae bacterium]|nr:hypothetical protein [Verrucomicrobiaceae bacterium]
MNRFARLLFACVLSFNAAHAVELEGVRAPANTACPTPEEARQKMSVPDGYEVRCFAHEPMVINPVAMAWDARGRLWVVEAYEYPEGSALANKPFGGDVQDDKYHPMPKLDEKHPMDRVVILEDTDNDGVADKRTVFVEGLNLASAIICGDDGIYVGQQPHLLHFRDNDHDDKPDEWRVVLTGFGREDTHELVNSFCWGPDGWLYMTHGVFTNSKVRRPGEPADKGFKFDAGIGRCRPSTSGKEASWEFEVFADGTSNPWGTDYDAAGNFFVSACVIDHFFHMAPGGMYVRQGGAPENPYSYELLPSIVHHKHFRAAYAGVQIYQGGVYPQDTWGHAFIGNIHDNAIHEEVLTPAGSTFTCEPRRDFLRANNGWFRPVSTRTGPDGNLWIMDWCDKYPCYQNAKANPEGVDREKGRIWRVVYTGGGESRGASQNRSEAKVANQGLPEGQAQRGNAAASASATPLSPELKTAKPAENSSAAKNTAKEGQETPKSGVALSLPSALHDASRPTKDMDLSKLDTPALVKLLEDSNNWMRRMGSRCLEERWHGEWGATTKAPPHEYLLPVIQGGAQTSVQGMAAAWTLLACQDVTSEVLVSMGESKDVAQRMWAARICGQFPEGAKTRSTFDPATGKGGALVTAVVMPVLMRLASDGEVSVRLASAVALRQVLSARLTVDTPRAAALKNASAKDGAMAVCSRLLESSREEKDGPLQLLIWQSLELLLTQEPAKTMELLSKSRAHEGPLNATLTYKSMRRLCDTRDVNNLNLALDFLTKITDHDVLLAHALDGLEKGQDGGVIKPTKDFSALFATLAESKDADVRKHAQSLATLWGDEKAVKRLVREMLDAKTPEAQRLADAKTLRKVRGKAASDAFVGVLADTASQPNTLVTEVIRATSDLGGEDFIAPLTTLAASKDNGLRLAALGALSSRTEWTHAMLDAVKAKKILAGDFPVSIRRQLATNANKNIRDHAFSVLGAWQESDDNLKALIATKRKACLEGEPDLAAGKLLFQGTCMVCHTFYGGGQKVGPELIGSGRSNLDAILANVIDPNQIIGNGYEGFILTTKDNQTLMGRVTEDAPSHVKLLAIGGAEQTIERTQIAKLENTHRSLMPVGFGGLPDDQFRNLIWYVLAPPDEGPLTKEKKKLLSTSVDAAPAKVDKNHAIDWESVSLWNPQWKISAPEFDRTPVKLGEYYGRQNVLLMHPFPDKTSPTVLEHKFKVDAAKHTLKFAVAADDRGDWELVVSVNGKEARKMAVDHDKPRWKEVTVDLGSHTSKDVTVRLEGHPTGWSYEFGYWADIRME